MPARSPFSVGDKVLVTITGSDGEGSYTLSTIKVERPKDWSALEKAFAENRPIAGRVTELVKGGLRVDVGVPAFLPASRSGAKEQADLEKLVGQDIQCKIIKLDTSDEDVVVDRRTVLEEEEKQSRQKRLAELVEGATVRGTVRSVTDFGAFVDLGGGLDGLLHVTDMAWHRVAKPSDFVNPGDSVEVKILKISPETRRISLGMKQLTPDPWTLASESFQVGQRVHGKVSRLAGFRRVHRTGARLGRPDPRVRNVVGEKNKAPGRRVEDRRKRGSSSARRQCRGAPYCARSQASFGRSVGGSLAQVCSWHDCGRSGNQPHQFRLFRRVWATASKA